MMKLVRTVTLLIRLEASRCQIYMNECNERKPETMLVKVFTSAFPHVLEEFELQISVSRVPCRVERMQCYHC